MAGLFNKLQHWLRTDKDKNFIKGMDRQQEADLGFSKAEIADFAAMPDDTHQKMEAMANVFGLTPDDISAERWRETDIVRACGHCGSHRECDHALRSGATIDDARRFCPNYQQYMDLKAHSDH